MSAILTPQTSTISGDITGLFFWNIEQAFVMYGVSGLAIFAQAFGQVGPKWNFIHKLGSSDVAFSMCDAPNNEVFISGKKGTDSLFVLSLIPTPTSISEVKGDEFSVYPNPIHDYIVIDAKKKGESALYSSSGALVEKWLLSLGRNTFEVADLSPGIYILKVGVKSQKVFKD